MAPTKPSSKKASTQSKNKLSGPGKPRSKPKSPKAKTEVKTKRTNLKSGNKKQRTYTAEELGVPKLNGIIPAGVQKTKGKKKGKVFVDDAESMLAIMGMVHAEKEGEREGKIMKARQLEEIREAKRMEAEKRQEAKKEKFEKAKEEIRQKSRRRSNAKDAVATVPSKDNKISKRKKSVSFT